jgi:hypothetical protein
MLGKRRAQLLRPAHCWTGRDADPTDPRIGKMPVLLALLWGRLSSLPLDLPDDTDHEGRLESLPHRSCFLQKVPPRPIRSSKKLHHRIYRLRSWFCAISSSRSRTISAVTATATPRMSGASNETSSRSFSMIV